MLIVGWHVLHRVAGKQKMVLAAAALVISLVSFVVGRFTLSFSCFPSQGSHARGDIGLGFVFFLIFLGGIVDKFVGDDSPGANGDGSVYPERPGVEQGLLHAVCPEHTLFHYYYYSLVG